MGSPLMVVITIDTEEDEWSDYARSGQGIRNIKRLTQVQKLCDSYGACPTYLCTYAVATQRPAQNLLRSFGRAGAELGAHCHPWNTPPFEEPLSQRSTMLKNLTREQVEKKLTSLATVLTESLGAEVGSFRAGRWGLGPAVTVVLEELDVEVDSSVTPRVDWREYDGPNFMHAPSSPYRFSAGSPLTPDPHGPLIEFPVTIGFLQRRQDLSASLFRFLASRPLRRSRLVGALDVLGGLQRRWLSPETTTADELIRLCDVVRASGARSLNLTFHSNSLLPGATPFAESEADSNRILARIERFLAWCRDADASFATLHTAAQTLTH